MNPSKWSGKRILCLGDCSLDVLITGTISRHAPESATCPVLVVQERTLTAGMAGNVAAAVVRHGGEATLLGVTGGMCGFDPTATALRRVLDAIGVNVLTMTVDDRPTTVKKRMQVGNDLVLRVDEESTAPLLAGDEAELLYAFESRLPDHDAVVLSDYGKGVCTPTLCQAVIRLARERGLPVVVDPYRGGNFAKFVGATLLKPNMAAATGRLGELLDLAPHVLVTRGAEGMILLERDLDPLCIPAVPCRNFAAIGAGDRMAALLALALAAGASALEAARTAVALVVDSTPARAGG